MASFYPLHVTHIRPDTRDAVVVTLRPADEHKELFRFKAGQYLTFRRKLDDEELRRSYSICSAEQDHDLRVGIKKAPDGWFSRWANEVVLPKAIKIGAEATMKLATPADTRTSPAFKATL